MKILLLHLLLTFIWGASVGQLTIPTLVTGFVLGFLVLAIAEPLWPNLTYTVRFWRAVVLFLSFVYDLVASSVRVAIDVVRPGFHMEPAIVKIPLDLETDAGIMLMANMITLTPGTMSLEVADDRDYLYIHSMYLDEGPDEIRNQLKSGLENRIQRVMEEEKQSTESAGKIRIDQ